MKDFSKWADMWDAYTSSGDAVPGSPAGICLIIGVLLLFAAFILPVIVLFSHLPDANAAAIVGFAVPLILGMSFICVATHLPSHTDASAKPPVLYEQIVGTWNLDDLGDCRNTDGGDWLHGDALPESELRDGDWNCTVYKGGRRTAATVHIHGDRVGLYDSKGKAVK